MRDNKANQIIVRNSDHHENLPSILETLELLRPYFKNDCHFKTTNEKCGLINNYTRKEMTSSCLVVELAMRLRIMRFHANKRFFCICASIFPISKVYICGFSAYANICLNRIHYPVFLSGLMRISAYQSA